MRAAIALVVLASGLAAAADASMLAGAREPAAGLIPRDARSAIAVASILWALAFALGVADRWLAATAAVVVAASAAQLGGQPMIVRIALLGPTIGWTLIALLPRAPYGSWPARGRPDPGGGWRFPPTFVVIAWASEATALLACGLARIATGAAERSAAPGPIAPWLAFELAWPALAMVASLRPALWCATAFGIAITLLAPDQAPLGELGALWVLHAVTFDPAWIAPKERGAIEHVFFDGTCGLCHGFVRFVLAEDRAGSSFRFAPLQGDTYERAANETVRARMPDSLVVRRASGELLVRSQAVLHVLERLGGLWRAFATVGRWIPRPIADAAYDRIARARRRWFRKPDDLCPLTPRELADRFDR